MHFITQLDPPTLTNFDIFEPRQYSPSQSIGSINKELYEEEWDIWPEDANDHIVEFEESYLDWLKNYESSHLRNEPCGAFLSTTVSGIASIPPNTSTVLLRNQPSPSGIDTSMATKPTTKYKRRN